MNNEEKIKVIEGTVLDLTIISASPHIMDMRVDQVQHIIYPKEITIDGVDKSKEEMILWVMNNRCKVKLYDNPHRYTNIEKIELFKVVPLKDEERRDLVNGVS